MQAEAALREAMTDAFARHRNQLGKEITDEMALPSYLNGNALSRFVFWRKLDVILRIARLRPRMRVLDFGCGSGVLLPSLAREGREVFATDLVLDIARDVVSSFSLSNVNLLSVDRWETHVADGSIDVVVAANVLEHVEDREAVLGCLKTKLRPHGRLIISGPTENAFYRLGRRLVGFSGHYHVARVDQVLADAAAVGFRRISCRNWPIPGMLCLYRIAAFAH
jgi:2-polyprenyl-3-methyl-5-hydroxy-6-metoxy-1,4-benzoquinol methylase